MLVTINMDGMPSGDRRALQRIRRNVDVRASFRMLQSEGVPKDDALERVGRTYELSADGVSNIIWPRRRRRKV